MIDHLRQRFFLLVLILIAGSAEAVTLRISVEPPAELPGLPRTIRVSMTNTGAEPVEVPVMAALQDTPSTGEPYIAYSGLREDVHLRQLLARVPLILAPGETRDVSFWASVGDGWFEADPRLLAIGTHRVHLVLDAGLDSSKMAGLTRILDQPGLVAPIESNETSYTVLEPKGSDLAVWKLSQELRQGTCAEAVAKVLWRDYPDSRYAAFCSPVVDKTLPPLAQAYEEVEALKATLAKKPDPLRADWWRLRIADAELSLAWRLEQERNVEESLKVYRRAQTLLEDLEKNAVAPPQRTQATGLKVQVRTREDLIKSENARKGIYDNTIKIEAPCAEKLPDGGYGIWFGYANETRSPIAVPTGLENKFTPPPFDRGQPSTFRAGVHSFAFRVTTSEPHLTWHLQKKTVLQIKPSEVRACPPGFDPEDSSTWYWDEY